MAENTPSTALQQFEQISQISAVRQVGLLLGLAASIAIGVGVVFWAQGPDYSPLYADLTANDASQIITQLEQSNVDYVYEPNSGMISVAAGEIHQVRMRLASAGLPRSSSRGFDILQDDQSIGTSSFMETARFDRALEEELALSIQELDSVQSARVHLAIPKQTAFMRSRSKPNASIVVGLYPGRVMGEGQVAAIVYLVASSVSDLEPEGVTLLDQRGSLLSSRSSSPDLMLSNEQFRFRRQIEDSYMQRINDMLIPIVGNDKVRVQVTAEVDFTSEERTEEQYSDKPASVRSEQTLEEQSAQATASGIPGTLSATAPGAAAEEGNESAQGTSSPTRKSVRTSRNYELDRIVRHVKQGAGRVERLAVAVVLDNKMAPGAEGEAMVATALSQEELQEIENLVKEAVGFSAARGDTVTVSNMRFATPEPFDVIEESIMDSPQLWSGLKILAGFIALIVLILSVLRPALRNLSESSGRAVEASQTLQHQQQNNLALQGLDGQTMAPAQQTYDLKLSRARTMVNDEPTRASNVIKSWVGEDA